MRSVAPALLPIFRSQHQAELLSRLFLTPGEVPMTDLARDLDIPLTTLHREAERLEEAGLLTSRRVGRTRLLRANPQHPAARPLTELLTVTFGPEQVIAEEFAQLGADRVIIFGSWARRLAGEPGIFPNNLDVLVVGDDQIHDAARRAADAAQTRLGLEINTSQRTPAQWQHTSNDPLVADIREHPFTQVIGTESEAAQNKPSRHIYRLRPSWHPRIEPDVFVPADLALLTGTTSGTLDPPVNLYWQPGELDFGTDRDLRKFYSSAIRSLATPEEFAQWIDADALTRLWPQIALPSTVRKAWETMHPQLRNEDTAANARLHIQDTVREAIADLGFALAGRSALLDYDIVTRDTDDIDAFLNSTSTAAFTSAVEAVIAACDRSGWTTQIVWDQDWDKKILVTVQGNDSTVVQLVHHQRSTNPERRPGGGLRLIFSDVVGGKGVAAADASRGRDFDDLAHIVDTPGWSLAEVEEAMRALGYTDKIADFRASIARFRRGDYDQAIRDEGFDPAYAHSMLDQD